MFIASSRNWLTFLTSRLILWDGLLSILLRCSVICLVATYLIVGLLIGRIQGKTGFDAMPNADMWRSCGTNLKVRKINFIALDKQDCQYGFIYLWHAVTGMFHCLVNSCCIPIFVTKRFVNSTNLQKLVFPKGFVVCARMLINVCPNLGK